MKKICSLILSAVMALTLLTACGSANVTIDVNEAADTLKTNLSYAGSLEELGSKMLENTYDEIDTESITAYKAYVSADVTAEEVAVFEMKDDAAAAALKTVLEAHVQAQKEIYADYSPEGVVRLEKAVIRQSGKYVILCISDDTDKVASEVDKLLK